MESEALMIFSAFRVAASLPRFTQLVPPLLNTTNYSSSSRDFKVENKNKLGLSLLYFPEIVLQRFSRTEGPALMDMTNSKNTQRTHP